MHFDEVVIVPCCIKSSLILKKAVCKSKNNNLKAEFKITSNKIDNIQKITANINQFFKHIPRFVSWSTSVMIQQYKNLANSAIGHSTK